MKNIFIILSIFSSAAYSSELYYYSAYPQYLSDREFNCDKYVRENADNFKTEMNVLLKEYIDSNKIKIKKLLKRYSNGLLANTYIKSIANCGSDYKFSNGINYYRELFKETALFISSVQYSMSTSSNSVDSIQEHHEFTIHYLNIILSSENKAANK